MSVQKFINNFETQFIAAVKDAPVSGTPATELDYGILRVSDGAAGVLVNPTGGDFYILTAYKRSGTVESNYEIMRVTAVDNATPGECRITVERAQEGTTIQPYVSGDRIALRFTAGAAANSLQAAADLSDLGDVADARDNLGLGDAATKNVGTGAGTVAAGDHLHSGVYQPVDATLTALAGVAISANELIYGTGTDAFGTTSLTAAGRALLDDADAATQRATLGLGTVATLASDTDTTLGTDSDLRVATQKATKAYADSKVADAINNGTLTAAPSQNAVFDALALKADLASPALTGTPTAPTAVAATNTTQLATTAHVFAERGNTATLTAKTIALGSNTVSGTTAQFNTALTDGDFATLAGSETLTNKTLTAPVIATISNSGTVTLPTGTRTLVARDTTDTLTNKTLTTPVIGSIVNTGTLTLPTATDTLVGRATTDTLTNKGVNLANNTLTGTTAQFNTALSDGDFATLAGTESLSNKTLANPTITDGYTEETVTANTGTAYTINLANGSLQILTLTGNCTYTFPTPTAGRSFTMIQKQDGTGGRTPTWPSSVEWPGDTPPPITTTANRSDKFVFTADGTKWVASVAGQNYAL